MLIGLAALLLALLLGGDSETILLDPDMKKHVHEYVEDKGRIKEINALIKGAEKSQKAFTKNTFKPLSKELEALNLDYNSSKESYTALFTDYYAAVKSVQTDYITNELKIRKLITEEEWNNIMQAVQDKKEKDKVKEAPQKSLDKMNNDLMALTEKTISDKGKLEQVKSILLEDQQHTTELLKTMAANNYKNTASVSRFGATREDFEAQASKILKARQDYASYAADIIFEIKALTTEDEWKKLAKKLNSQIGQL